MTILVIDAGTSGVRAVAVADDGTVVAEERVEVLPSSPAGGLVEIDAAATAAAALDVARAALRRTGPVAAVGIANQRASTIAWDIRTGRPVGPGIGWQDIRTVGRCLELQSAGVRLAPNLTATKAEWLVARADIPREHLRVGTMDTWLAWHLSGGALSVTDATNAQVTGLYSPATGDWDPDVLAVLDIPRECLPVIVDSAGALGTASAIGDVPLTALVGDQQASLIGQGCIRPGEAKITFGTGGMLDICLGPRPGPAPTKGTFPIIGWQIDGQATWAREAVMLTAGTCVEWLRDGLGLIDDAADSEAVAASVPDADGVVFVPALSGLGTPRWDHGARGLLTGLTRGTTRAHVVRAVLEGVAHRAADLVEATETDTGQPVGALRIDGGMSRNGVFVQAVADATGHRVECSGVVEATALGAAFLAGTAAGIWASLDDAVATRPAGRTVDPAGELDRAAFARACDRAAGWIPELSALDL